MRLKTVFFEYNAEDEFKEMLEFISRTEDYLGIEVIRLSNGTLKEELQILVENEDLEYVILGNRRIDPYSKDLKSLEISSPGWP